MPSGSAPDRARPVVVERRARAGPGLGRAVALEDGDAEVLPGLLEGRRQEGARRQEQPEVRHRAAGGCSGTAAAGAAIGSRRAIAAQPLEGRAAAALLDLALDGAPEQVEHLGDDDHARDPVLAQRVEDDPRVAAADVQDVGADIERVEQRRPPARAGATAAAARRSGAPSAGTIRWNDSIDATTLSWASITPFGVPVVPLVKISSNDVVGVGACPGTTWRASQSGGKAGSSSAGSATSASTVVVGKSRQARLARVRRVAARAEDEVPGARRRDDASRSRPSTSAGRAARGRAGRASRRSRWPASSGVDGLQVRIRSPGSRSSARRRHAAIRARRSSSR